VDFYADLAAHSKTECTGRYKRPFSCREKRHCIVAIESRATSGAWSFSQAGIVSSLCGGPEGCTVALISNRGILKLRYLGRNRIKQDRR
jgi:hypothetical protein